jgi:5-methylcytosine-specific restriction enzyme B
MGGAGRRSLRRHVGPPAGSKVCQNRILLNCKDYGKGTVATFIDDKDSAPLISAANAWVRKCLIEDGSIFGDEHLWTMANLGALDKYFAQNPDAGSGSFYEKLKVQLEDAPAPAKRLMAEMLWALFLFPSNIAIETKRDSLLKVWSWSGEALDPAHPMLADAVLNGIGSGGMGINNHRWRELVYMIGMAIQIKGMAAAARQSAFASYENFVAWVDKVPQDGERQFRQMLRYFLFPERVERMSSNGDRIKVLSGFGIASAKDLRKWSDEKLDSALLTLRQQMEVKYDTKALDFYRSPLREVWKAENEPDDSSDGGVPTGSGIAC